MYQGVASIQFFSQAGGSNCTDNTVQCSLRFHKDTQVHILRRVMNITMPTSGFIHGDLLRLLYLLADNKTKRHFRDLDEDLDADSEAYCWRMRASLGLACAQATTLSSQVFGKGNSRSRAGRPSV